MAAACSAVAEDVDPKAIVSGVPALRTVKVYANKLPCAVYQTWSRNAKTRRRNGHHSQAIRASGIIPNRPKALGPMPEGF